MPWKPKSICNYPGCQSLTRDRYCEKHKKEMMKVQNDRTAKMYTYQWRKASKEFLKKHPLCVHCEREGRLTPATEVDHIKPHTVVTGNSSGTKTTGNRFVKVVTPRRPLKKMEASEIIQNPRGGRGSESLQKA